MYVTRKTLAECLGLSTRRITQLRHKGVVKKNIFKRDGSYKLEESVRNYLAYKLALCQHHKNK